MRSTPGAEPVVRPWLDQAMLDRIVQDVAHRDLDVLGSRRMRRSDMAMEVTPGRGQAPALRSPRARQSDSCDHWAAEGAGEPGVHPSVVVQPGVGPVVGAAPGVGLAIG